MKINVFTSAFPEPYETFIKQEVEAISTVYEVEIHTLKKGMASKFNVSQHALFSFENLKAFIYFFIFQPNDMFKVLYELVQGFSGCPRKWERAKSFCVWPLSCRLAKKFSLEEESVMLAHWSNVPSTMSWIIFKLIKKPYILEIHGENISFVWRHLKRKCLDAKGVLSCTDFNKERLRKELLDLKIRVCPHGTAIVKSESFKNKPEDVLRGLSVGRLVETKGFDVLLEALGKLHTKGIHFKWTLIGNGPEEDNLKRIANSLGILPYIDFKNHVPHEEVLEEFSQSHLFVLPIKMNDKGDSDGLPNVILEAMAHGCAVISAEVAAVSEAIEHEVNGCLIRPGDASELRVQIERLFSNADLRSKIVECAKETIFKKYGKEKSQKNLLKAINEIIHS